MFTAIDNIESKKSVGNLTFQFQVYKTLLTMHTQKLYTKMQVKQFFL
jgi:hypothetical protein